LRGGTAIPADEIVLDDVSLKREAGSTERLFLSRSR